MFEVAFDLPIDDPQEIFELYWSSLKKSVVERRAIPPRAAVLISGNHVELVNVQELGGFARLTEHLFSREQITDAPLQACIISFEVIEQNSCDGKLVAILFPGKCKDLIAKTASWTTVGNKVYCEDAASEVYTDCGLDDLSALICRQVGYA